MRLTTSLLQKIESRQATIGVIGLGYVGLPLAMAFVEAGFRVVGIDIDEERVDAINRGESYIRDVASGRLAAMTTEGSRTTGAPPSPLAPSNRLVGTTNYDALYDVDVVIICVPTPLSKTKDPDMSYVIATTDEIARRLHRDMLIVLESTTYPGTTRELILPRLQAEARRQRDGEARGHRVHVNGNGTHQSAGLATAAPSVHHQRAAVVTEAAPAVDSRQLEIGKDFFLAFSPERIDPGRTDYTIRNTPKVIGGTTPRCTELATALYQCAIQEVVPVSSPRVAEMVKLLENTFRAVNIALVNEVAIMCDKLDIDVWEVIDAARTKPFGFMTFYPGPGLGGHCIPIDPLYLAWKLRTMDYNARFIQLAGEINVSMPRYVLRKIAGVLNDDSKALNGSQVLILGVAYKADVSDLRESPALHLIHLLSEKGTHVVYHDPYVPRLEVNGLQMTSVSLDPGTVQAADCVVITTAHSSYDWQWVVKHSRRVVDTRNATQGVTGYPNRIVKL